MRASGLSTPNVHECGRVQRSTKIPRLRFGLVAASAICAFALSGCARPSAEMLPHATDDAGEHASAELTAVTLQLNWFPEAEHGGYYAALVHGYYREQGLDVEIVPGGPDSPVVQRVARGAVDFGIANADNLLFGRAQQAPVVALFAPLQESPRCILVHESSKIQSFDDLRDVTLAVSASNAFAQYLRYKLPLKGVKVVPYSGNVAQFLIDPDLAQQGYVFSEPFVARKKGGDPRVLMVSKLGYNPYTSVLFTSDALLADRSELVEKMVAASAQGWKQYLESPEQANAYIHRVNPQMDLDILAYGAETLVPLVLDETAKREGIGTMSPGRWQQLADQLVESGQLKPERIDVSGTFTTKYVDGDE